MQEPSGDVELIAGVGRRILLSVEAPETEPPARLLANSLAIYTSGGILAGWARIVPPAGAIARESLEVSGGFLRIAPFIPGRSLRTYTQTIDVLVVPGGAPIDGLALHPGKMWNEAGSPTPPRELEIVLEPVQHMTALTEVDAKARFEFTVVRGPGNRERSECSTESDFQLVDHDSVLPALWTLQRQARLGSKHDTLALYNQSVGAFPAMFLDPATAAGFARWLRETHAVRVGDYEIGLIAPEKTTGFRPARNEDVAELAVKRLGSD